MTRKNFLTAVLFIVASFISAFGQTQSQYDKGTPPQLAAGVSAPGSYMSTELGTVNLSNGGLNINIPLGTVGGRGSMSVPLMLSYSSKVWSASTDVAVEQSSQTEQSVAYADYDNQSSFGGAAAPGWTLRTGIHLSSNFVRIKQITTGPGTGCYTYGLHKLTLNFPDKGEIEFRDDETDGAPLPLNCTTQQTASRGTRWHATDGSGAIFVNDVDNGVGLFPSPNLSGTIIFADGTRFGTGSNGAIVDRNGNKIAFTASGYTDQLGRNVTIQYGVTDPDNSSITLAVLITIPGYQGTPRYYKIKTGIMNANYRSGIQPTQPVITGDWDPEGYGYNWGTATRLFAKSYGLYAQRIDDREVLTEVELPDERSLKFRYNEFGEVAEIELPTGGKIQYDYAYRAMLPSGNSPSWEVSTNGVGNEIPTDVKWVDRAVTTKRTYPDGVGLEGTWSFGYASTIINSVTYPCATVSITSNGGMLLSKQRHIFLQAGRYTEPYNSLSEHDGTHYTLWSTGVEWRTESLDAADNVLAATEQDWTQRSPVSWSSYPQEQPQKDNRVNQTRKYLETGMMAKVETLYDQYNNPTEVKEYDYDQTLKRRTATSYVSTNNGYNYQTDDSIHLLRLPAEQTTYDGSGNQVAKTVTEYDVYTNDGNRKLLTSYPSVSQHDSNYGTAKTTRGNPTRIGTWRSNTASFIYTYPRYDIIGNVVSMKDPKGNVSTVSFVDDFGDGSDPGTPTQNPATPTYALPTLITTPPPVAGAPVHTARSQYDYSTGLLTGFRDRNNVVSQTIYSDPFNRPTLVKSALGISGSESHSVAYYAPTQTPFGINLARNDSVTASDQTTLGDKNLRTWTVTDGFGRTKEAWKRDSQGNVKVATTYDALGRPKQVSNPFRPSLGETEVYTTTAYDLLGRVTAVTGTDNSVVSTTYSANTVTVTDEALKKRKSLIDALGRLKEVYEDPTGLNYLTSYQYDALDNLISVTQGTQTRTFTYNSLKQLLSATNPESGTVSYQYDDVGNLLVKTDARNVSTHYSYDAFNRTMRRWYNGSSALSSITHNNPALPAGVGTSNEANYFYDVQALPSGAPSFTRGAANGRLVAVTYGTNSNTGDYFSYDSTGQNVLKIQRTGSINYQMSASVNLSGSVTSLLYPSGRIVAYGYDVAARTASVTGNLGDGVNRTYANNIQYSPFGSLTREQFGTNTPLYRKSLYNIRGQLFDTRLSSVNDSWDWNRGRLILYYSSNHLWGQSGTDNNGNVIFAETWIPPENATLDEADHLIEDSYSYDALNRLTSVTEQSMSASGGWVWQQQFRQAYSYDRFGNRTINAALTWGTGINNKQFTVNTANNRLGVPVAQPGLMEYDNAGNLKNDTYTGAGNRTYDAENKITSAWGGNNQAQLYSYDADGRRVKRTVDGVETWQVYGFGNELLAEYPSNGAAASPHKEYGYRNEQLLVTASAATGTNQSLSLNGTSAYVQVPSSASLNITGSITVEAWVKINAIGAYRTIVSREGFQQTGTGGGYRLAITETGKVRLDLFQSHNTYVNVSGTTTITPGVWTHVAGVFDGTQMRVYLNGVVNGTLSTTSGPATGTGTLHIGRFSYSLNPYYFNGVIDDVRVSNSAVYTSNFTPSNNLTATGSTKGLWKFNVLHTNDTSGNNNHGAVHSGATYSNDVAGTGGGDPPQVRWLVADHLGTPRMIVDQTGSLANLKRHDYLPFGEELFPPTGGRTVARGYPSGDGVRQQFTSKERDLETGLDYFLARYYSSSQGRFTSIDPYNPILHSEDATDFVTYLSQPQNWNRYGYVLNNPLKYVDPFGEDVVLTGSEQDQKEALERLRNKWGEERFNLVDFNQQNIEGLGNVTVVNFGSEENQRRFAAVGGDNAYEVEFSQGMADIIGSSEHVEYRLAETFSYKSCLWRICETATSSTTSNRWGGGATLNKDESLTGNVQIFVSLEATNTAAFALSSRRRFVSSDGDALTFTKEQIDAHEFGHAHNVIKYGMRTEPSYRALRWENILRLRQGSSNTRIGH